jgi:hypothetical protein
MKKSLTVCLTLGAVLVFGRAALPHHSFAAEFDATQRVTLTGTLTKLEWTNPHAFLHLDVVDAASGQTASWAIELGSPNGLTRLGWRRTTVSVGEALTIEGSLARHKPLLANAASVIRVSTGQKLGAASSEGQR